MKIAVCFLTFIIGYTYATTCSDSNPCDPNVTSCGQGYHLKCLATSATENNCVCVDTNNHGAHTCTTQADCHANHLHHCNHGHWQCQNGHCHCGSGAGNGKK
ncbi:serine protease inhibitor Cvsi-2-like [Mercenaria mercenaria]|uniref:serine protease inhibitor Cvsi-2-like n=1 Tax=Mercenaria mercenaria TaxID=6596 RepID=UPI00234FA396|nr:serine protease inhibitor Cvsi-2-like [Mercenaria mercenaria]